MLENKDSTKIALDPSRLEEFGMLHTQLQDFYKDMLIFIRCELASRCFYAFRELSRVNFSSNQFTTARHKETIKAEVSIQSLMQDYSRIFKMLADNSSGAQKGALSLVYRLCPKQLYWLQSQTYLLCLVLFRRFLRYLRVKRIDQTGMYRLRHSLHLLQKDFSQVHLRATKARLLLEENSAIVRETM